MCRFGCHCVENPDHVLFDCIAVQDERQALKDLCYETKIDFNLINIMTQPSLQFPVERLLLAFFTLSD